MESVIFQNNEYPIIHWKFCGTNHDLTLSKIIWSNLFDISLSNIKYLHVHIKNIDSLSQFLQLYNTQPIPNVIIYVQIPLSVYEKLDYKTSFKHNEIRWGITLPNNMDSQTLSNYLKIDILSNQFLNAIYYPFDKTSLDIAYQNALSIYTQTGNSVILTPNISLTGTGMSLSWKELDSFYNNILTELKIIGYHKGLLMKRGILSLSLLMNHPCNAYMCSGHNCHSRKGNHPRSFIINTKGDLYPITDVIPSKYCFGNLKNNSWRDIFSSDYYKKQHCYFIEVCRSVFDQWLQHCPFTVVPWETLFELQANTINVV